MSKDEKNDLQRVDPTSSLSQLDKKTSDLAVSIMNSEDVDEIQDLTNLFNLNNQKRNVVRVMKMSNLLDTVTDKVIQRFENTPDNFTNEDLLKYMQVTENAIDRANKNLNMVETTPAIQLQQNNQVNINVCTELDRESRQRVTEAVQAMMYKLKEEDNVVTIDGDSEEIS